MNRSSSASKTSTKGLNSTVANQGPTSRSRDRKAARDTITIKNERFQKPPLGSVAVLPAQTSSSNFH